MTPDRPLAAWPPPIGPTRTATAEHYDWGGGCDGWHLVRAATLSVIEERMPPGTEEVRHWHARSQQFFYVLSGDLALEVDGTTYDLPGRTGLHIPAGLPHRAHNRGTTPVEFLVISEPPSHRDRRPA